MTMTGAYTVTQLNKYIKNMFAQDYLLTKISVKGEISNCTYHASGHIYFTLKDKSSVISCVMWRTDRKGLSFSLDEGKQVIVTGQVGTYEPQGKYQLYASRIEEEGLGDLYKKFIQLKEELEERGMFDPMYKKPIPPVCNRLGVVTAPTGAAIRDIISIAKGRNPYIQIILYPALVQGEGAAESIVRGIKALESANVDTMIVGRGGGSLEDLWAFNEEIVAQAIFDSPVPIISAVGHETDTTISDFVADARAETPTAAAQMATNDIRQQIQQIDVSKEKLQAIIRRRISVERMRIEGLGRILSLHSPRNLIKSSRQRVSAYSDELVNTMRHVLESKRNRLAIASSRLDGVSPVKKLSQGYSYTGDTEGRCINSVDKVKVGDRIVVTVTDGRINARVDGTERISIHE